MRHRCRGLVGHLRPSSNLALRDDGLLPAGFEDRDGPWRKCARGCRGCVGGLRRQRCHWVWSIPRHRAPLPAWRSIASRDARPLVRRLHNPHRHNPRRLLARRLRCRLPSQSVSTAHPVHRASQPHSNETAPLHNTMPPENHQVGHEGAHAHRYRMRDFSMNSPCRAFHCAPSDQTVRSGDTTALTTTLLTRGRVL